MSACRAGCGAEASSDIAYLCFACECAWHASPERRRYGFFVHRDAASMVAVVDFCTRVRLEREADKRKVTP